MKGLQLTHGVVFCSVSHMVNTEDRAVFATVERRKGRTEACQWGSLPETELSTIKWNCKVILKAPSSRFRALNNFPIPSRLRSGHEIALLSHGYRSIRGICISRILLVRDQNLRFRTMEYNFCLALFVSGIMFLSRERAIRKRKRGERLFSFHNFADPGFPADYDGPFRDNVRAFLEECAETEVTVDGLPGWCVALEDDSIQGARVNLLIFVEGVQDSLHPYCDQCRCIGSFNSSCCFAIAFPEPPIVML